MKSQAHSILLAVAVAISVFVGSSSSIADWPSIISGNLGGEIIRECRDRGLPNSEPLPDDVLYYVGMFQNRDVIRRARYRVGWTGLDCAQDVAFRWGGARAITLDNLIVFRTQSDACDFELWAHELRHVEQYHARGINEFVDDYLDHTSRYEADAEESARNIAAEITARGVSLFRCVAAPPPPSGRSVCRTAPNSTNGYWYKDFTVTLQGGSGRVEAVVNFEKISPTGESYVRLMVNGSVCDGTSTRSTGRRNLSVTCSLPSGSSSVTIRQFAGQNSTVHLVRLCVDGTNPRVNYQGARN